MNKRRRKKEQEKSQAWRRNFAVKGVLLKYMEDEDSG